MSFKPDSNQRGVPAGQVRFIFNKQVNGIRTKERVACRRSEVHRAYADWEESLLIRSGGEATSLFALYRRYLDDFVIVKKSQKQYRAEATFFEKRFSVFFDNMQLVEFRRVHVERYLAWRSANKGRENAVSRSTLNKDLNMISSFMSWAIRHEFYPRINPCKGLRLNEQNMRHIHLTGQEIAEIIEKASSHEGLLTVIMIGIFAGLRKSEMTGLKWSDVDLLQRRIDVRAETSKGHKRRSVPIPDVLADYLARLTRKSERVTISEATLKRQFHQLRDELSFRDRLPGCRLRVHDLRHIYAQSMRDAGVSLDDLQHFLGHSTPVVTHQRYAQAGGHDGANKVNLVGRIVDVDRITELSTLH